MDDSNSMRQHWKAAMTLSEALACVIKNFELDNNGVDLHFTVNKCPRRNLRRTRTFAKALKRVETSTVSSNLSRRLGELLDAYSRGLTPGRTAKGMQIYVLTDGEWQRDTYQDVEREIKDFIQKLDRARQPHYNVGIQFIRFGDDENNKSKLERLDRLGKDDPNVSR
jgi:hypothetical protein